MARANIYPRTQTEASPSPPPITRRMNHFLDVPVYRLPERDYYQQRDEFTAKHMIPVLRSYGDEAANPKYQPDITRAREHFIDVFGGIWRFNEIVGYVRLHFLGSQVRGDYFAIRRKRMARTRHKQFEWITHKLAPEVEIEAPVTNATVQAAVRRYLEECKREVPRRYVDLSGFEVLAPHICWYDLWATENPFGPNRPKAPDNRRLRQRKRPATP